MTRAAALLLIPLVACAAGEADDVCRAERLDDPIESSAVSVGALVPTDAGAVHVVARWPERGEADARWPIAVFVHGAWSAAGTPIDEDTLSAGTAEGLVAVHLDLPGGGESTGPADQRGAASRAAVAAALRWAAGEARDLGGCTLPDRVPQAAPEDLVLIGTSNGGNLAVATLADATLDTPTVTGLVTWETPASATFVGVEHGVDPTVYTPGTCTLSTEAGVTCAFPEERLRAAELDGSPVLCFDLEIDGRCAEGDVPVRGTRDPVSGSVFVSPALAAAAEARGELPVGFADAATAEAWWAARDATRLAPALVANRPDLPVLVLASEEDHVQSLADHPHVYGLLAALQAAGAAWTRLNPGIRWLPEAETENDPDLPVSLDDPRGALLSEDAEQPTDRLFAAAVRELADRRASGDW